jgi:hypothetical protein
MKNIPSFESFVNESVLNEATAVDKVQPIAREFLKAIEAEFKTDVKDSQILKMTPKGFEIRAVIKENDKMYDWASNYTEEHKDDLKGIPLRFAISPEIPGRSSFWPSDNKKYFDVIEESLNEDAFTSTLLILQAAMVGGQIALLANKVSDHGGSLNPIENLKDWWNQHKKDKAVQSIITKLKDDQDVIEFLQLPRSKQEGQWKKLIAPKLNADELKYINSISRDRVKTGKI